MSELGEEDGFMLRDGAAADESGCVELWVAACAARDGVAVLGVAERARAKFTEPECWIVAEDEGAMLGFVLGLKPATGLATDPTDAPIVGLLAVVPHVQGRGLGRILLAALMSRLGQAGHKQAVLHVLTDHYAAVHLYEGTGWRPVGDPFPHSLLGRTTQTYLREIESSTAL
jgi:ribosomal protein S18 acetylase RimI-like enzyme